MNLLEVRDVGIAFGDRTLYQHLSFDLKAGTTLALLGPNGVGKTSLIRALLGKISTTGGKITWPQGTPRIAYVPQLRSDGPGGALSIAEFVGLSFDQGLRPWLTRSEKQQVAAVLARCNLTHLARQRMSDASGGEQQRAYLAQALIRQPELLILDESTANMDVDAKEVIMRTVADEQQRRGTTVIMVTHDLPLAGEFADAALTLSRGSDRAAYSADVPDAIGGVAS
ncbi:ATP-binding cassette domain-containing protein [Lacticaseibacillus pabuli]|uniref:ATP-binding cassette domain-containing protein n=1 Tax=Lacticaseibacillus pabuli TaxID=3025672 RepID=A0ABY7WS51_9LACO|nr:ATP-binding cassette domain-containing protein [Lacticaseibacillus sp. KACC 23028]WDF83008.1 ATP-binding cassette domain-containing protein [Lacticaseibacillus sp. KACC 23028]